MFVSFTCSQEKKSNQINKKIEKLFLLLLLLLMTFCCVSLSAMLQDGGNGGVTSPKARRLEGLKGGVGDGGETQRGARHPGDIIEAA